MADDAKEAAGKPADDENLGIEEPDIETASDDALEGEGNKSKSSHNILIGLALAAAVGVVFGASFFVGKKATVIYRTSARESSHGSPAQPGNEAPARAVVSKGDETKSGEVKSSPKESAPAIKADSASVEREKVVNQFMEKEMAPAVKKSADPVATAERPPAPLPKSSPQNERPAALSAAVKPAAKPMKPAPVKKDAAKREKTGKEYKIIAGAFSVKENAEVLAGKLKANNYNPSIVLAKTAKGKLYRVVAGSYRSMDVTKTKIGELKKLGFQPFYIVE